MREISNDLPAYSMWRPDCPLDEYTLPPGFRLRLLRNDEGEAWCACCFNDMGVDEISQALFEKKMLEDATVPPSSIYCIEDAQGVPVATATAQIKEGEKAYLHMVAAREDMRGKGLGLPVCAAVIEKHRREGRMDCRLTTHDWRLSAVKQYVRLGFLPVLNHENARARWQNTIKVLGIARLPCVDERLKPLEDIVCNK